MKNLFAALLLLCLVVPVAGCGGDTAPKEPDTFAPLPGSSEAGGGAEVKANDKTAPAAEPVF